jgi:hypothetical protein
MRCDAISAIAALPENLSAALHGFTSAQLDTPYREGGWTVRQLVHHIADSHMNALIRVKLALTEENPIIKPYDEAAWALLKDSTAPIEWPLAIIMPLHARWVFLLNSLEEHEWTRTFKHPEHKWPQSIELSTQIYAWHSKHHVAHITKLREAKGW